MKSIVWLVMLYLLLDFSDPALPGAFSFDPDASVDAVYGQRADLPSPRVVADTTGPVAPTGLGPCGMPSDTRGVPVALALTLTPVPRVAHRRLPPITSEESSSPSPAA